MFISEAAMKTRIFENDSYRGYGSRQQELFDELVHQRGSGETCETVPDILRASSAQPRML